MAEEDCPRYAYSEAQETPHFLALRAAISDSAVNDRKKYDHLLWRIDVSFQKGKITEPEWYQAADELRGEYRNVLAMQGEELERGVDARMAAPGCDLDALIRFVQFAASEGKVTEVTSERVVNGLLRAQSVPGL